jgi:hypothetical protein
VKRAGQSSRLSPGTPDPFPCDHPRIRRVESFRALATTPFVDGVNARCWARSLPGDFSEVVTMLGAGEGIVTVDEVRLSRLRVSAAGRVAIGVLLEDQRLLRELGLDPELNCIHGYARDDGPGPVHTDVFSFHVDRAEEETDTWLCTYFGAPSEGLHNEEARRLIDLPETRARLLERFDGEDDRHFGEYLNRHCLDLHYSPVQQARPFSFGLGHLWRIATEWAGSAVPPCIHRAPPPLPGQPPRLLLIC